MICIIISMIVIFDIIIIVFETVIVAIFEAAIITVFKYTIIIVFEYTRADTLYKEYTLSISCVNNSYAT